MQWFINLKVKSKLIVGFSSVIFFMAALMVFSIIQLNTVSSKYTYAIEHPIEAELQMRVFDRAYVDMRRLTTAMDMFSVENDAARIDSYHQDVEKAYNIGLNALDAYEESARSGNLSEKALAALAQAGDLRVIFVKYKTEVCDGVAAAARVGDSERARGYSAAAGSLASDIAASCQELIEISEASAVSNVDSAVTSAGRTVWILLGVALFAALLSILIALYIAGLIGKPLVMMSRALEQLGTTGDLNLPPEVMQSAQECSSWQDEIGRCARAFGGTIQHIGNVAGELETMATGDLTVSVEQLSDNDVLGKSLNHMCDNLNHLFGEINNSTMQVASGSKQIADGSQTLAQGSTQQASSIEQLSASVTEIAQNTKTNADMANKAATLANTIKNNAEKGNRQMDEMTAAVKEINTASHSIQKVIKVIDDIAFQTNILALNAAVEAARAGQHGKGFAVVAEEVRNLASKSADAARDTGDLIANSMEKAELGTRIANDTAASLAEIVQGINESSQIVEEIARSSEQQSTGIAHINHGIDQVAHVVQQNSATAEQSAAASEEMSGQSTLLEELVAQFKLRNDGNRRISRPAQGAALPAASSRGGGDFGKY